MAWLRNFFRLPARERRFLLKVTGLVTLIRLGLWFLPFRVVRRWLDRVPSPTIISPPSNSAIVSRIVWAVELTSAYIPQATCLTQALAAQTLMKRRGYPTRLRLGVIKNDAGKLEAHAWVEWQGKIIIGGEDSPTRFATFSPLEGNIQ